MALAGNIWAPKTKVISTSNTRLWLRVKEYAANSPSVTVIATVDSDTTRELRKYTRNSGRKAVT